MTASDFATVTADDLVTGEGVALDLPAASLGLRMASGLIDVLVTVVTLILLYILLLVGASVAHDEALLGAGIVLTSVVTFLVIPTALETLTRGRSVGKLALGLRTVRDDGGPISFQHALVRALIGFVEIYAFSGAPAFFSIMLSTRGKRLGDYAAGTYVVRERVPLRLAPPPPMPPQLAAWARRTDLAALPTGTALAVRQFLGRLPTLDPVSRDRVGRALLADVSPYVAPPPPPGAPPELVLMAVVAERRERDLARLRRDDRLRRRLLTEEG
ncbi:MULTISPECIES: RDD family protein [unclassified Nocardioides]|uniref:RDD family protein n=1 Tax=unclassified Nocardioides TaxID=2615069 RepID=UPI001151E538|nr:MULTISPECIES: RDD family protein [unclassified Nocardioides]TQK72520.1 putative RDD family membrane protein YckC [Nocardioides sp. SLBN-35]WGY03274.1 RDD family protein [Nocardioides sp. QY071]